VLNYLALFISLFLIGQVKAGPDKWVGNWKLNLLRSKFQSGPLPKSRTLGFQEIVGGFKATSDLLDDIGIVHIEFTAKYDGRDVPMRGSQQGSTISATRTDAFSFQTVQKTSGQVTVTTRYVVSRDGKVLSATSSGVDPDGQKFTNISVYDKQP
jgi:hypothetical protein